MKLNQLTWLSASTAAITQRIGALHDAYLSRGRSLGLSRLLWEIGPAGCGVRLLQVIATPESSICAGLIIASLR